MMGVIHIHAQGCGAGGEVKKIRGQGGSVFRASREGVEMRLGLGVGVGGGVVGPWLAAFGGYLMCRR